MPRHKFSSRSTFLALHTYCTHFHPILLLRIRLSHLSLLTLPAQVEVVYETLPGWQKSTRGITKFKELPPQAQVRGLTDSSWVILGVICQSFLCVLCLQQPIRDTTLPRLFLTIFSFFILSHSLCSFAQAYIKRLEEITGVPVAWIGTGPGRHEMIARGFTYSAE